MIFDDNFFRLTKSDNLQFERQGTPQALDEFDDSKSINTAENTNTGSRNKDKWSSEHGNPDFDYVIESDLVSPKVETFVNERPLIVVVDDDFETLDLLEIYLKRNYDYASFSGPREAIFYLNQRIPSLILLDCRIHTMKATTFADIVRSGAGKQNIPFVYLGSEEELSALDPDSIPEYVVGCIKRPVARGDLQAIVDKIIKIEDK